MRPQGERVLAVHPQIAEIGQPCGLGLGHMQVPLMAIQQEGISEARRPPVTRVNRCEISKGQGGAADDLATPDLQLPRG